MVCLLAVGPGFENVFDNPARQILITEAVILSLALVSSAQLFPGERESREKGQIRAGLTYVRSAAAWMGSTPVGGPIVGLAGQQFGARWALIIGGVPTLLVGLATLPVLARVDRRRAQRRLRGTEAGAALTS